MAAATHISVRVPGDEAAFLINPMGLMFDEMTASRLVKVSLSGDVLPEYERSDQPGRFRDP